MSERMTAAAFRAGKAEKAAKPRKNKFNAKRVTIDGREYDSKAEARRGELLITLEKAGKIGGLERQRRFPLLSSSGELITTYVCDFAYWSHERDRFVVEDVKGVETPVFKLKRKMMRALLGIEVEVVR